MLLDFAAYLREAREMYREVAGEWERPLPKDDLILNDYLNLDVTLSQLMQQTRALNPDVPNQAQPTDQSVVDTYAQGLVQFLLISLKQQWTHLMVLEDDDLAQFKRFPQRHLLHQFDGIKTMLLNSYHQKRQADFSHAWRSYLKLGLNELDLDPTELDQSVRQILAAEN
ncbi:dimeric dUTPase (all-alpha-NTP-PPase superfamily) [Weissella uvarum]|uniref:dUTPase n=1 Tax=Weissella uvarum TaxID=1479233 RepID=UPI0019601CBD|nr:dUTPase [Weissella uvarum]MBM7616626.1 dimeric dUTPase (all-alpha-NTP-PPase superfamily) [Weissella uvarum]MCM0594916.1 dUTPase [Weissella uvarum]